MDECQKRINGLKPCEDHFNDISERKSHPETLDDLLGIHGYILMTLLLHRNVTFTVDELNAHMPYYIRKPFFKDYVYSRISPLTENYLEKIEIELEEERTITFRIRDECYNCMKDIFLERENLKGFGSIFNNPDSKDIEDRKQYHINEKYYDNEGKLERDFMDEGSDNRFEYWLKVYAWPIRCVIMMAPDLDALKANSIYQEVIQQIKNVSHHYGDYFKLMICNKYDNELKDYAMITNTSLLTWHDYTRFKDLPIYDLKRNAPTISEWIYILDNRGIGSHIVLDIIRERFGKERFYD